ncbi:MAG: Ig-like domain-containing protein [Nocardioides sp.]
MSSAARTGSRLLAVLVSGGLLAQTAAGCSDADRKSDASNSEPGSSASSTAPEVTVETSLGSETTGVPITHRLKVTSANGQMTGVSVQSKAGKLPGKLDKAKTSWAATGRLEPGTNYAVVVRTEDEDGEAGRSRTNFRTRELTLDQQTYASVAPLAGETVGIGMPVTVSFDVPVEDKATFEKHMTVTSTPRQGGSWHWLTDREVHWRPEKYWRPGTAVSVDVDVNSIPAGAGVYGQESRRVDFRIGDAVVSKVDARTHQMQTFRNGVLLRTTPITTGKPGFTTRSGVKVIMEKFRSRRMRSETVGIPADSAESYDIDDVEYAMRLTYSGEFLHAAPWSVGSQGSANVSHGCTGMSTADAGWLYGISKRGDVVEYTGTDRWMSLDNGYGDWNLPFAEYRKGSALS